MFPRFRTTLERTLRGTGPAVRSSSTRISVFPVFHVLDLQDACTALRHSTLFSTHDSEDNSAIHETRVERRSAIIEYVERTINVPDDLLVRIEGTVAEQGKTVDQWIEEALRAQLEERVWQDLLAYGRERGLASGYSEEDVPHVVKEWRREHRAR